MKVQISLLSLVLSAAMLVNNSYGQSSQADAQKFTFANAVEFLRLHTGLGIESFDEKSFKFHQGTTISNTKVSGLYLSTLPGDDRNVHEFFIRTDNVESAGAYKIYHVAGCLTQKPGGLSSFIIRQGECGCATTSDKNFVLKARDVNGIF
ncbi:MAG: hypothetical protein ACK4KT_05460 [Thermaurantimonas sp.]